MIDGNELLKWMEENADTEDLCLISVDSLKDKILSIQKEGIELVKFQCLRCEMGNFYLKIKEVENINIHCPFCKTYNKLKRVEGSFYLIEGGLTPPNERNSERFIEKEKLLQNFAHSLGYKGIKVEGNFILIEGKE